MSGFEYDLFVIGAGSGGVRAARIAARYGAKVAVAEEYRVGGTCVIRGCVPKKLFVYASKFAEEFEDAIGFGWTTDKVSFDWATLVENKDKEIDRLNKAYIRNLEGAGAELILDRATVEDANTVRLASGRKVTARYILVATGATPFVPRHLPGHELAITSNEAFHLERLPSRIVIVGGGYIAVEFAGIFSGLGVETVLVCRGAQILRGFDDDIRNHLAGEMKKKGIELRTQADVSAIERSGTGVRVTLNDGTGFGAGVVRKERGEWGRGPAARSAAPRPPCRPRPTSRSLALQDMAAQLAIPSRLRVKLPPSRLGGVSTVVGDALEGWRGGGGSPGRPEPANEAA